MMEESVYKGWSLIQPGNYDASFNQKYLIEKLHAVDKYSSYIYGFWISAFLFVLLVVWILSLRKESKRETIQESKEEQKNRDEYVKELFWEFQNTCRLIHEDLNVFRRPTHMVRQMYYPRMKEIIHEMSLNQDIMRKHYQWAIPDYEFYRKMFIKDEIDGRV